MDFSIPSRFKKAWLVFTGRDPLKNTEYIGPGNYARPDRSMLSYSREQTIVTSVFNRISLDVSSLSIQHVRLDDNNRFKSVINSGLNNCLTLDANVDQTGRAFIQESVLSMFDEGCVALVPTHTDEDPDDGSYDILEMRVGKIVSWYPSHVKVSIYNELIGRREEYIVPKDTVAIIQNPFYEVMNESNSTLKRLTRKLQLLDILDEKTGNGKLDIIIQLPYVVKNESKKKLIESRRKDIEDQLMKSTYGIAWVDATEHITQLNRPAENNMMSQIEYLTNLLYSQLNITAGVLDGTADEATMLNYQTRTVEPIANALVDEMKRKFLTKTARTQHQSIEFFKDPFKLVPVNKISEIADKFTRNEIMTPNEIRQVIGMKPAEDPEADVLRNRNINQASADKLPGATVDENGNPIDYSTQSTDENGEPVPLDSENQNGETNSQVSSAAFGEFIRGIETTFDSLIEGYKEGTIDADASSLANIIRQVASQYDTDGLSPGQAQVFEEYLQGLNEDIDSIFGNAIQQSDEFGESFLHYASPYYDPVKAHEYYMRTRKLKGRKTSSLSEKGKEVWEYTKSSVEKEKKGKIEEKQKERDTKIEESRTKATESRTQISNKLKSLNEVLSNKATRRKETVTSTKEKAVENANNARDKKLESIKSNKEQETERLKAERDAEKERIKKERDREKERLQKERDSAIERINKSSGMSSAEKKVEIAKLRNKASEDISKVTADSQAKLSKLSESSKSEITALSKSSKEESIKVRSEAKTSTSAARETAKSQTARINSETKAERASNTANAKTEREKVADNLKSEISNARQAFTDAKTSLTEHYEKVLDTEYEKIATEYPKETKKKTKK